MERVTNWRTKVIKVQTRKCGENQIMKTLELKLLRIWTLDCG